MSEKLSEMDSMHINNFMIELLHILLMDTVLIKLKLLF
jgi:hypothetical protein